MARSDDFNRDMEGYLRQRRVINRTNPLMAARNYFKDLFSREEKQEVPLDIPQEQIDAVIAQNSTKKGIRNAPAQPVTAIRQKQPVEQPKQVNNMGWFGKKRQEDDDYEMVETAKPAQLDEDVKEVLKITFKWLKQMDPETVEEIKASSDFQKYKAVLDKYGLIKK
jgi:hypothetical protein